jgi:hypothetical protein
MTLQLLYCFPYVLDDLDLGDLSKNICQLHPLEKLVLRGKAFSQGDSSMMVHLVQRIPFLSDSQRSSCLGESCFAKDGPINIEGDH